MGAMSKGVRTLLIGGFLLLLVTTSYLFGKIQTLSSKESATKTQVESAHIEVTVPPTVAPKKVNTYATPKPIVVTPTPTVRVPVVLTNNGMTYYCDPSSTDAINEASAQVKDATTEYINCGNRQIELAKACSSGCLDPNTVSSCVDNCYKSSQKDCNYVFHPSTDTLNNLLSKYCNK